MRFITEFEITKDDVKQGGKWPAYLIDRQKEACEKEMGVILADSFGWQNPVNGNSLHHRMEIEAFPMHKWIEFKEHLFIHLKRDLLDMDYVLELFKTLESFGKPAGEARDVYYNQEKTIS